MFFLMNYINKQELEQVTTQLLERKTNFLGGGIGRALSTDECGSIFINSAASGNYGFFSDLQMIARSVEKDRIIEALCYRSLTNEKVQNLKFLIDILLMEAQLEYNELLKYQPVYLGKFAPKQLGCYKKADQLLKESSFTIKKCMDIFETFTKKPKYPKQREMISGCKREWCMSHTIFATQTPQTYLDFTYDSFTQEGKELIDSFKSLMEMVDKLMSLCCQTLELEAMTKSDLNQLNLIHDNQFDEIKSHNKHLFNQIKDFPIDEMSMLKNKYSWEEFLKMAYHAFTDDIMKKYTVYQIIMESKKKNIDNDFEKAFLLDNDMKRDTIKRAIENFDDIVPKGHGGKLPAFYLSAFFIWCGIDCDKSKFYNYFWEEYKGKYNKVSDVQFYSFITRITIGDKAEDYKSFAADMKNRGYYLSF